MPRYYIKFSGCGFGIEADTPEKAWENIRKNLDCYSSHTCLEIGKDVDELGYTIRRQQEISNDHPSVL